MENPFKRKTAEEKQIDDEIKLFDAKVASLNNKRRHLESLTGGSYQQITDIINSIVNEGSQKLSVIESNTGSPQDKIKSKLQLLQELHTSLVNLEKEMDNYFPAASTAPPKRSFVSAINPWTLRGGVIDERIKEYTIKFAEIKNRIEKEVLPQHRNRFLSYLDIVRRDIGDPTKATKERLDRAIKSLDEIEADLVKYFEELASSSDKLRLERNYDDNLERLEKAKMGYTRLGKDTSDLDRHIANTLSDKRGFEFLGEEQTPSQGSKGKKHTGKDYKAAIDSLSEARRLFGEGKYTDARSFAEDAERVFTDIGYTAYANECIRLIKDCEDQIEISKSKANWAENDVGFLENENKGIEQQIWKLKLTGDPDQIEKAKKLEKELSIRKAHVKDRKDAEKEFAKSHFETTYKGEWLGKDVSSLDKEVEKLEQERDMCIASGDTEGAEKIEAHITALKEHRDKRKKAEEEHLNRHIKGHVLIGTEHEKYGKDSKYANWLGFLGFGEEPLMGVLINILAILVTWSIVANGIIGPVLETFSFFIPFLSVVKYIIYIVGIIIFHPFIKAILHPFKEDIYAFFEDKIKKDIEGERKADVVSLERKEADERQKRIEETNRKISESQEQLERTRRENENTTH